MKGLTQDVFNLAGGKKRSRKASKKSSKKASKKSSKKRSMKGLFTPFPKFN
jgi:hypothetical protein